MREVEARAAAFGIRTGPAKLMAYAISGGIAGLGGALFALQQGSVSDLQPFILRESLLLVAVVVIGGARSPIGILLAAFLLKGLPGLLGTNGDVPVLGDVASGCRRCSRSGCCCRVVLQPTGIGGVLRDLGAAAVPAAGGAEPTARADRSGAWRRRGRATCAPSRDR